MSARRLFRPASSLLHSTITSAAPTRSLRISPSTCLPSVPSLSQPSNRRHLASRARHPSQNASNDPPAYLSDNLPRLGTYDDEFIKRGVPGLLSAVGFRFAWTEHQQLMVNKVKALVAGEAINSNDLRAIAIQYARDPLNASLFNHASMGHNNHFFFQGLSTSGMPLEHKTELHKRLAAQFGSIDDLRISFIESAANMFGPGFTWLVWDPRAQDNRGAFKILNTYAAGTPYGEAGHRRQEQDMATNNVGSMGAHSAAGKKDAQVSPGSSRLFPLMCVNTWTHVWMYDYGVGGKRDFLNNWWDVLDWEIVHRNYKAATFDGKTGPPSYTMKSMGERRNSMVSS